MGESVSWKLFWTTLGGAVTLAIGLVPTLAHVTPLAVIPVAVLLGAGSALLAGLLVRRSDLFVGVKPSNLGFIVSLIRLAIGLHVAWIVMLQIRPDWWMWWPLVLVGLSCAEYATAYGREFLAVKLPPKPTVTEVPDVAVQDKPTRQMRDALLKSDLGAIKVQGWTSNADETGHVFGIDYQVQIPSRATQRGA